jgi:hypothetical protein
VTHISAGNYGGNLGLHHPSQRGRQERADLHPKAKPYPAPRSVAARAGAPHKPAEIEALRTHDPPEADRGDAFKKGSEAARLPSAPTHAVTLSARSFATARSWSTAMRALSRRRNEERPDPGQRQCGRARRCQHVGRTSPGPCRRAAAGSSRRNLA